MENDDIRHIAQRALGRCWGALFFSVFGACWLLLSAFAFGVVKPLPLVTVAVSFLLIFRFILTIQNRAKKVTLGPEDGMRKRDHRVFGVVNLGQWSAIFLIFAFFPRLGLTNLVFPTALFVIGAHFFFMPPSYRHTSNYVTGAALCIWAVVCPLFIKGDPMSRTDPRTGELALGAGIVLWVSAGWALRSASRHLQAARL